MNEIKKMTDNEYFESEGLSNSFLIQFDRSPKHAQIGVKETSCMNDGKIIHMYILQPELFLNNYFILPNSIKDKRSREYKEFVESETKELLLYDYFQKLESVKNNLLEYELLDGLTFEYILNHSEKEISIFWEEEITGEIVQKKAKLDILFTSEKYNIIIDLKKTENCIDFQYAIRNYKLYRQAAFYSSGIESLLKKPTLFIFLTFEFENPFGVKAFMLDESYIEYGNNINLASVIRWIDWGKNGSQLIGYKQGVDILQKPNFLGG